MASTTSALKPEAASTIEASASESVVKSEGKAPIAAVTAKKEPPPETVQAIRTRIWVIFSFWAVALFLGVPAWLSTTSVVRSELPAEEMKQWSEGKACKPVFPLRVALDAPTLNAADAENLLTAAQEVLNDLNDFPIHQLQLYIQNSTTPKDGDTAFTLRVHDSNKPTISLSQTLPELTVTAPLKTPARYLPVLAPQLAQTLHSLFEDERETIASLLSSSPFAAALSDTDLSVNPSTAEKLRKREHRALKYARNYHLTFSLFTPHATPNEWPIAESLKTNFNPLLSALNELSTFDVDTQVQLFASPPDGIQPHEVEGTNGTKEWRREDLATFINHAEWPLPPSIGASPTLNFIIYITPHLITGGARSWLIPQFGAVVLLPSVEEKELNYAMARFGEYLLQLLGVPEAGDNAGLGSSLGARIAGKRRTTTLSLLTSTASTLGSLLRLSHALATIPIPAAVAELTASSIAHLHNACGDLAGMRGLEEARVAREESEKAFFEKEMVAQVYFPDEHRIAVYLPLLGPVGVPLVMAGVKTVRAIRERRKRGLGV